MNRTELIVATALVLFLAFLVGWLCAWVAHRLSRPGSVDAAEHERMAQSLHEAEQIRDRAVAQMEAREAELNAELAQVRAEQAETLEALRAARSEAAELRDHVERVHRAG